MLHIRNRRRGFIYIKMAGIEEIIGRAEYKNIETRCFHQNIVYNDPSIIMQNSWYDKCFVCVRYELCSDYTKLKKENGRK